MHQGAIPLSEIRDLLRQVQGIDSVDVHQGPNGAIEGIEIEVSPRVAEKRVVRDVESALVSGLGLHIDHHAINIRRTSNGVDTGDWSQEQRSLAARVVGREVTRKSLPARLLHPRAELGNRVRFENVRCEPDGELHCETTVELELFGETIVGTDRESDTRRGRLLSASRATASAVATVLGEDAGIALEGVEEFAICEAMGVVVSLRIRHGRTRQDFYGAALVADNPPEAAARATLDALNRFLETQNV